MVQRIEQRSGEKPVAIVKRANYVNGRLTRSIKVYNGNRWVNTHPVNMMTTNVGARSMQKPPAPLNSKSKKKTKKTKKAKKAKKAKKTN